MAAARPPRRARARARSWWPSTGATAGTATTSRCALDDEAAITAHAEAVRHCGSRARAPRRAALEHAIEAVRARRPDRAGAGRGLLLRRTARKDGSCLAAARHQRVRRAAGAAGRRALAERPELRAWLEAADQSPAQRA